MHSRARIAVPILLLIVVVGGGYWFWRTQAVAAGTDGVLRASGTIEAEEVLITAEVPGRIKLLPAQEGHEVAQGSVLAQLDTALMEAQLEQARASVAVAEANLALLRAGATNEEVTLAEAQVAQAQAARDGAVQALENARQIAANPQDLNIQIAQAQASRDAAQRQLQKLRAGSRPEDITAAEAAFAQAQANLQAMRDRLSAAKTQAEAAVNQAAEGLTQAQARYAQATYNWEYVKDTGNDPIQPDAKVSTATGIKEVPNEASGGLQEQYYAQFVQAEAAMHSAEQAVQQAIVGFDAARQAEVTGIQTAEEQVRAAQATLAKLQNGSTKEDLAIAQTALASAQRTLDVLLATRDNPQQLNAAADTAAAQLAQLEAQLEAAEAKLELVRTGARNEQLQAGEAQLAQARAAQRQIEVQISKATLTAPRSGLVLSRSVDQGEMVVAGAPLMSLGSLDTVRLTIYIAETDIGHVRQGQKVQVTVDSFPGRVFDGTVSFIAQEAQFTPRNVQTQAERVTTVFAVRVDLANTDHALKPGMPADAELR